MKSTAKGLKVPPRKMNVVAALVRNRSVKDALTILDHTPRRAAGALKEVIKSAQANAEHNDKLETANLQIDSIIVTSGGMVKRFRPNARMTFRPYRHRLSNVAVKLATTGEKDGS